MFNVEVVEVANGLIVKPVDRDYETRRTFGTTRVFTCVDDFANWMRKNVSIPVAAPVPHD